MTELEMYYRDNFDTIVKKLTRRAGSPHNAEDIAQEAFARALRFYDAYDSSRPFEGWFVNILNNSLREFKVAERNYGMSRQSMAEQTEEQYEGDSLPQMYREEVSEMIEKSGEDKEILRLYFLIGYKTGEIVKVLDERYRRVLYVTELFRAKLESKYAGD
jgi:RNA polymerase sigma factor (sigma-70 family)